MVLQLLNGGADPYVQDANGNTALHVASSLGFHKIVEILIDAVCDPFKLNLAGFSHVIYAMHTYPLSWQK